VLIWDAVNWHHDEQHRANEEGVTCLAFSGDGTTLATGGGARPRGGNLLFWDVKKWQPRGPSHRANERSVMCLAFSPDGKTLVTGGADREGAGNLILWDTEKWAPRGEPLRATDDPVLCVGFGAHGKALLAWGWNAIGRSGSLLCWRDYKQTSFHESIIANESVVRSLTFDPKGQTLATAGRNGEGYTSVYLWNLAELVAGEALRQPLPDRDDVIQSAVYTPDLKSLISGGRKDQNR
jgi:WD40 repeat protein